MSMISVGYGVTSYTSLARRPDYERKSTHRVGPSIANDIVTRDIRDGTVVLKEDQPHVWIQSDRV